MERWAELKAKIIGLENEIKAEVLLLKKTQDVGNVRATFAKGRKTYDYESIAKSQAIPPGLLEANTQEKIVTDWRNIVKAMNPDEEIMTQYCKVGKPSVTLKILEPK